ncbi:MAG: recombination protein RecR [Elusimicrobia bacterium RIFOXYA12_FULL_51_18]|nr:MAG: recombination protein RecR [Elusimicrobia bacterium RIFOXYA12_FULL_51_18]OGS32508.1 MAG: recombination protein RecR [Elusimicrobia bacterium RIFOXYA2_FULL_53_38]
MKALEKIITHFRRFPGVGPKQAERFALYVIKTPGSQIEELVEALRAVKSSVAYCRECYNYAEGDTCSVCEDHSRDRSVICVVSQPQDVAAIEKAKTFNGVYHVLHGVISPMDGVNSTGLKLKELIERIHKADGAVAELIIATNPDTEGETTAIYLTRLLKDHVTGITRIAYGVPLGGDIDYMDEVTLGYALKGRTKV